MIRESGWDPEQNVAQTQITAASPSPDAEIPHSSVPNVPERNVRNGVPERRSGTPFHGALYFVFFWNWNGTERLELSKT